MFSCDMTVFKDCVFFIHRRYAMKFLQFNLEPAKKTTNFKKNIKSPFKGLRLVLKGFLKPWASE